MEREELIQQIHTVIDTIKEIMRHDKLDSEDVVPDVNCYKNYYKCKEAYNILCSILLEQYSYEEQKKEVR